MLELVVECDSVEITHARAGTRVSVCMSGVDEKEVFEEMSDLDIEVVLKDYPVSEILKYIGKEEACAHFGLEEV